MYIIIESIYTIERPVQAILILDKHQSALSQSLSDPVTVARALYEEQVITGEVLTSVESTGLSVPERRRNLSTAVREAIKTNYRSLETFATVLCKFGGNIQLGEDIHSDYGESEYLYMM